MIDLECRKVVKLNEHLVRGLDELVGECRRALVDAQMVCRVTYPTYSSFQCWPVDEIDRLNSKLLDSLNGNGNLYAIHVRERKDSEWRAEYVGKSISSQLRQRMRSHLIHRTGSTSSKLDNVKEAISRGQEIGVTFVMVEWESVRNFVEEEIIDKGQFAWNKQNPGG